MQPWSPEGDFTVVEWRLVDGSAAECSSSNRALAPPHEIFHGVERRAPAHPPLPPALESLFGLVCEPVLKLETSLDAQMTLREISILLGDVLDVLEEELATAMT